MTGLRFILILAPDSQARARSFIQPTRPVDQMTSITDEFRGKAQEAQVMELETHDPFLRRAYSKLARHWSELADRVDREESLGTINRPPEVRGNHID